MLFNEAASMYYATVAALCLMAHSDEAAVAALGKELAATREASMEALGSVRR